MTSRNPHARSPPPGAPILQHPVPQHAFKPPPTPDSFAARTSLDSNPGDYQRFSSSSSPYDQYAPGTSAYGMSPPRGAAAQPYAPPPPQQRLGGAYAPQQPAFGGWNVNEGTTQMGIQFGKSAVAAGHDYVEKNFTRHLPLPALKALFNVSTNYVGHKLRILLFPWRHRPWLRQRQEGTGWLSPREDVNSPDLYIPVMALVTYIILVGVYAGLQNKFHPEVLGLTASKALAIMLIEFMFIRLGCYLLGVETSGGGEGWVHGIGGSVELVAYGGYKFVSVLPPLLISLLLPGRRSLFYPTFIYCLFAQGFFLLRSLKYVVLPDASSASASTGASVGHAERGRRIQFLFLVACFQVLWMGWLAWI